MRNEIEIIQGDTFEATLSITGIDDFSVVENIVFSCAYLGIKNKIVSFEYNEYVLRFTPEETQRMKTGIADFDITVCFYDKSVYTIIYRDKIRVLQKTNIYDSSGVL